MPHEGPFRFAAMGQLRAIKGYDVLIRAFARLPADTALLDIAGEGVLHGELQALIDRLGVTDRCHLVGVIPRENTPDFMNRCDAFVCSSRHETLSCVLNEAAACGKPLIATACGGPQDIVTAENGLLVPVDDEEALAEAMRHMMQKAANYSPADIRAQTVRRFGTDTVADRLLAACARAAEQEVL